MMVVEIILASLGAVAGTVLLGKRLLAEHDRRVRARTLAQPNSTVTYSTKNTYFGGRK